MPSKKNQARANQVRKKSLHIEVTESQLAQIDYFQRKGGFEHRNDFILATIDQYIKFANGDYQLPSAEIARLNQLIAAISLLTDEQRNLRNAVNNGFTTILRLSDDET